MYMYICIAWFCSEFPAGGRDIQVVPPGPSAGGMPPMGHMGHMNKSYSTEDIDPQVQCTCMRLYLCTCNSYTTVVRVVWNLSREARGRSPKDKSDKSHTSPRPPWDNYFIAHPW